MQYSKSGSGPLLIYVAGLDGTGRLFFRQEPSLASRYTVVTFPLRRKPPFDYVDLANDVLQILDSEKAGKATLVAESFGGTIALHFAMHYPNRINRLVLINTFPYFRKRFLLRLGRALLPLAFHGAVKWGRNRILAPVLRKELIDEAGITMVFECSWSQPVETYRQRMELIARHDVRDQLSGISVPVTIVASGKDKLVPSVREAHYMAGKIPNAAVVILPHHGHTPLVSGSFSLSSIL